MTREMGKVLSEARGDVQEGIDIAFLMAGEGRRMFGDTTPSELPDKWAMSIRQPIGIAGIITPWNFPMAIPCWKMMPALVTGNVVIFKPSSDTPHCATLLVELMAEAGVPAGVVNLVTGSGGEVGDAIVENPDVAVISFTGSSSTGKRIATKAGRAAQAPLDGARRQERVVVLADADLDLAADGILWSAFGTTGQRCTACSRVIVERSVVEPLLERLEARARKLRLGPGLDETTDVGPLINAAAVDKVDGYVGIGRAEGELVIGGGRATTGDLAHGHFFEPTIFAGVRPMDRIGQEEIFGPVLSVIPVADYGEAMLALNQTRYGLSSSIFTQRREPRLPGDARLRDRHRVRQRRHDRRRDPPAVRRLEGDRQRPPRGGPRRARHVHRVEVDLRRLQRPAAARPDRQPAGLIERTTAHDPDTGRAPSPALDRAYRRLERPPSMAGLHPVVRRHDRTVRGQPAGRRHGRGERGLERQHGFEVRIRSRVPGLRRVGHGRGEPVPVPGHRRARGQDRRRPRGRH